MAALLPPLTTASTHTGDDITSISTMSGRTTEHLDTTPEHPLTTDSGDLNTIATDDVISVSQNILVSTPSRILSTITEAVQQTLTTTEATTQSNEFTSNHRSSTHPSSTYSSSTYPSSTYPSSTDISSTHISSTHSSPSTIHLSTLSTTHTDSVITEGAQYTHSTNSSTIATEHSTTDVTGVPGIISQTTMLADDNSDSASIVIGVIVAVVVLIVVLVVFITIFFYYRRKRFNKMSKTTSDDRIGDYTIRNSAVIDNKPQRRHSTLKSKKSKRVESSTSNNNNAYDHDKGEEMPSAGNYFQKGLEAQATMDAYETLQNLELEALNQDIEEQNSGADKDRRYIQRAGKPSDPFPMGTLGKSSTNRQSVGPVLLFNDGDHGTNKAYDGMESHSTFGV